MSEGRINDAIYANRPSVCRSCGALVGAGEASCSACGAPAGRGAPAPPQGTTPLPPHRAAPNPETLRFVRAVVSRPATFTFVFIVANVFVFVLMSFWEAGGSENPQVLRDFGAKFNSLIKEGGEWWRFVTPVFMHIGFIHILVNMYSLFVLGPYVEKLYGSAKFVVFWVLTGIAGVAASYFASAYEMHEGFLGRFLFRGGDGPSAGASGALFGLVGVLFVFGIKFRRELPEEFKRAFGFGMLPTILINLIIGYTIPFIDNAAHLGGFFAGVVLALFVHYKRPGERAGVAVAWHVLQFAALALVLVCFFQVWRHYDPAARPVAVSAGEISAREVAAVAAYVDAVNAGKRAFGDALDGDAPAAEQALEKLNGVPPLDDNADSLRGELKNLLERARDYGATQRGKGPAERRARDEQGRKLVSDFLDWDKRFWQWTKGDGKHYGIEQVQPEASKEESPAPVEKKEDK